MGEQLGQVQSSDSRQVVRSGDLVRVFHPDELLNGETSLDEWFEDVYAGDSEIGDGRTNETGTANLSLGRAVVDACVGEVVSYQYEDGIERYSKIVGIVNPET